MANVMDELLFFGVGVAAAKLTKALAVKYADPKANMNFTSLKQVGKPSVYIPGGLGVAATGYAVYQGDKYGRLKDEEIVAAGFGIASLVDTIGDLIASPAQVAAPTGVRIIERGAPVPPRVTMPPSTTLRGAV